MSAARDRALVRLARLTSEQQTALLSASKTGPLVVMLSDDPTTRPGVVVRPALADPRPRVIVAIQGERGDVTFTRSALRRAFR